MHSAHEEAPAQIVKGACICQFGCLMQELTTGTCFLTYFSCPIFLPFNRQQPYNSSSSEPPNSLHHKTSFLFFLDLPSLPPFLLLPCFKALFCYAGAFCFLFSRTETLCFLAASLQIHIKFQVLAQTLRCHAEFGR